MAGAAGAPVLHPPLQLLLVEHALLHLLLLHLLRVELLRVGHRAHPLLGEPLGVVLVGADVGALLAELVGLRALLLEERLLLLGDARRHLRLVLLQPLARALALLLGVLALELLAHRVLLVADLELDDLVGAPPRLLDLLQRLPLLLLQPPQPVAQQLDVLLRPLPRVAHVEHVRAGVRPARRARRAVARRGGRGGHHRGRAGR